MEVLSSVGMINLLQQIKATSSTNEKIALIKTQANSAFVKTVFDYTYNPFYNYFISPVSKMEYKNASIRQYVNLFTLLNALKSREITGDMAHNAVVYFKKTADGNDSVLLDLILKRDLCCGINSKTINKAIPDLITIIPYMRCSLPTAVKLDDWNGKKIISQIKADGLFVNAEYHIDGEIRIYTRSGNMFPQCKALEPLIEAIKASKHCNVVYHGELLVKDKDGNILDRQTGNGILNSLLQGGEPSEEYTVFGLFWDVVNLDVFNSDKPIKHAKNKPYIERLGMLNETQLQVIETRYFDDAESAKSHYKEVRAKGEEGTIIKLSNALWTNTTSKEQVKLKAETIVDLEVVGFKDGTGMNKDFFGAITCKSSDGLLVVDVGVSGFKHKDREIIAKDKDSYIGKIVAVKANAVIERVGSETKSLFLPRFIEWRNDKNVADSLTAIENQFNSEI